MPILFLQGIFVPLQGFFGAAIYVRPRLLRVRREYPELNWMQTIRFGVLHDTTPISEFLGKRGRAAENSSNAVSGPVGVTTPTQTRVASVEETPREDTSGNDGTVLDEKYLE